MTQTQTLPRLASLDRISKIPVVESGIEYAYSAYNKLKKSNSLVSWSLATMEGSVQTVVVKSYPILELPIGVVDSLVCKTLDEVEQRVPAINYPPQQGTGSVSATASCNVLLTAPSRDLFQTHSGYRGLSMQTRISLWVGILPNLSGLQGDLSNTFITKLITITKDMVSSKIVQPVLQRADSVKKFSVNNRRLSQYGEMAVSRLDTALDKADVFVEKYLPDSTDGEAKGEERVEESHTKRTIQHANRLKQKLQRRLTKRTIAEAQALRKTGHDVAQFIYFSVDLLIKDPNEFLNKVLQIWEHLSKDEPENQIPPANLDQLIALVARETARKFVHVINYSVVVCGHLPRDIVHLVNTVNHQAIVLLDSLVKTAHIEGIRTAAIGKFEIEMSKMRTRLNDVYRLIRESLEKATSVSSIELKPITNPPEQECQKVQNHQHARKTKKEKKEHAQKVENEKREPSKNGTPSNHETQSEKNSLKVS